MAHVGQVLSVWLTMVAACTPRSSVQAVNEPERIPVVLSRPGDRSAVGAVPTTASGPLMRTPFHVLAKPTGPICNLDCEYCFFLSKEDLYPGDRFRMSDGVLEAYLRQYIGSQPDGEVVVAWQGGEPTLMGVDFFARAVALADEVKRPRQVLVHTIQTNGTLITDEWADVFARHKFLVGISIDGPAPLHDRYRVDKRGGPTYEKVIRGLRILQAHQVEVNVLTTVHAGNQDHPLDVYRHVRDDLGVAFLQLIPIVEPTEEGGVSERTVDPAAWGQFLIAVFDEWVRHDVGSTFVQMFDAALASWCGMQSPLCIFRETCGDALALGHSGDLHSCDHFVDAAHLLGNITTDSMIELVNSPAQRAFGQAKSNTLPVMCQECSVRFACQGECPKNRIATTPGGEAGLNHLCAGYLAFFTHIDGPMRIMADLVRSGRFADEITEIFAAAGRNEPCPCGSGRKAKVCHGR